jgi:hypothetical protein
MHELAKSFISRGLIRGGILFLDANDALELLEAARQQKSPFSVLIHSSSLTRRLSLPRSKALISRMRSGRSKSRVMSRQARCSSECMAANAALPAQHSTKRRNRLQNAAYISLDPI